MNRNVKKFFLLSVALTVVIGAAMMVTLLGTLAPKAYAQESASASAPEVVKVKGLLQREPLPEEAVGMAFLAAGIVMSVSCVGAGIAVAITGSAAIGAVAERPELMGRTLLIVGLAEGIAIYGLIIAIMILSKV
ncbi:MAG: ATPase [Planctomycetes bacterium]|nr:ATPase [Planctomycetota bacterium]